MTGTIKKVTDKGFGFISDTKGQEYFFHQSGLQGVRFDDLARRPVRRVRCRPGTERPTSGKTSASSGDCRRTSSWWRFTAPLSAITEMLRFT